MKKVTDMSRKFIFIAVTFLLIGAFIGGASILKFSNTRKCDTTKFSHINQNLDCNTKPVVDKRAYTQLKANLTKYISNEIAENKVTSVSLYFRDLQYGPTLGVNEDEQFSPASLLKLPLLIAYLNLSDQDPKLLERKIITSQVSNEFVQTFAPKYSPKSNSSYTVEELLTYMIKYSDNISYSLLLEYLKEISPNEDILRETFTGLGIIDPENTSDETITVKSYASIFVQLYNATFLQNMELSEKALDYLTDTDFTQGIVSGVPSGIKVAHKFGERLDLEGDLKQLHDCGIVYFPGNPYLICVMTRGKEMQNLSNTISTISKTIYDEFNSRKL